MEAALRPYIYILLKLIYDLPIQHEDEKITALNDFKTVDLDYRIGLTTPSKSFSCGSFSQTASLLMQVEKFQYEIGVKYLLARLQYIPFDASNIKDAASTLLNSYIPSSLTNEYAVNDLMRAMHYKSGKFICCPKHFKATYLYHNVYNFISLDYEVYRPLMSMISDTDARSSRVNLGRFFLNIPKKNNGFLCLDVNLRDAARAP